VNPERRVLLHLEHTATSRRSLLAAGQITTSGGDDDLESTPTSVRTIFLNNATCYIIRLKCGPSASQTAPRTLPGSRSCYLRICRKVTVFQVLVCRWRCSRGWRRSLKVSATAPMRLSVLLDEIRRGPDDSYRPRVHLYQSNKFDPATPCTPARWCCRNHQ
jgi:hypothetical protein